MSRYIYYNRSSSGSSLGCGCFFLLLVLLIIAIIRAVWLLLPFIFLLILGFAVYRWLTERNTGRSNSREDWRFDTDSDTSGGSVRTKKRPIKDAEVIDDDET